jgi:hypothetical protein
MLDQTQRASPRCVRYEHGERLQHNRKHGHPWGRALDLSPAKPTAREVVSGLHLSTVEVRELAVGSERWCVNRFTAPRFTTEMCAMHCAATTLSDPNQHLAAA